MNRQIEVIPTETLEALRRYAWPGNVRELANLIERAMILSRGRTLEVPLDDLARRRPSAGAIGQRGAADPDAERADDPPCAGTGELGAGRPARGCCASRHEAYDAAVADEATRNREARLNVKIRPREKPLPNARLIDAVRRAAERGERRKIVQITSRPARRLRRNA